MHKRTQLNNDDEVPVQTQFQIKKRNPSIKSNQTQKAPGIKLIFFIKSTIIHLKENYSSKSN